MTRLAIVMPQTIYRIGLLSVISSITGFGLVWVTSDIRDLVVKLNTLQVDVVLLDLDATTTETFRACNDLKLVHPLTQVGVFVTNPSHQDLLESKTYQVDLSLPRNIDLQVLEAKLCSLVGANRSKQNSLLRQAIPASRSAINLKSRDFELLSLLKQGMTSKQIAAALCLSKRAIDSRRDVLLKKMEAKNCLEAVNMAIQLGLV
jgi:DNA-binding NarL/FixJ family response regulator